MGFGFGLSLSQRCTLSHRLRHSQKLGLKLLLEQKLNHPEYPNMQKGLEGMKIAHKILQERNKVGVLIGGLSEAIWNYRRKPEELIAHKDVDVAILNAKEITDEYELNLMKSYSEERYKLYQQSISNLELHEPFEGGIDWWLPQTERILFKSEDGNKELMQTWYENGGNVVLDFGLKLGDYAEDLPSGLYLPDSQWVIDMRRFEALSHIDYNNLGEAEIDDDIFEKFNYEKRKTIKTKVPKFISNEFGANILSYEHQRDYRIRTAIKLEEFNLETLRAIHYFKSKN